MRLFGSTQYVKVDGNYPDVKPFEEYLELEVKNMWDWNSNQFYLYHHKDFSYFILLCAKKDNENYSTYKKLKKEDVTEEYKELIGQYFKYK